MAALFRNVGAAVLCCGFWLGLIVVETLGGLPPATVRTVFTVSMVPAFLLCLWANWNLFPALSARTSVWRVPAIGVVTLIVFGAVLGLGHFLGLQLKALLA